MSATVDVECPVCDETVEFPAFVHPEDEPCELCEKKPSCILEDKERECPKCKARIVWHCDGEAGWPWVDDDDPAWLKKS